MNEGIYQLMGVSAITVLGLVASRYLDYKIKRDKDDFTDRFTKKSDRMNAITKELTDVL